MVDALSLDDGQDKVVELDEAAPAAESEVGGEGEATAAPEVVETIIEESDSQTDKVASQGSINRLVGRIKKAKAKTQDVAGELELERQKSQMLEIALQQEREAKAGPPDPSTFDDGISDPEYVKEQTAYIARLAAKEVQKSMPASAPVSNDGLERKQVAHATRANGLGIADYPEVQDAAIDMLGGDTVNAIIDRSRKSEIVLYYLGKNPDKAEGFRALVETDPGEAAIELGRLEERLRVKPKATTQPAPDPDEDLPGSSPSGSPSRGPKGATFE